MESFDSNQHNVKEKSVYLLHLDTPRIILIASVIIGVIAASFLFGMNFIGKGSKSAAKNDSIFTDSKTSMIGEGAIPPAPDSTDLSEGAFEKNISGDKDIQSADIIGKSEKDILTADNIKDIIQPPKESKSSVIAEKRSESKKKIASREASDEPKETVKKKKKKSKKDKGAIEVADSKKTDTGKIRSGDYAIQIGAYDKKSKADTEMRNLKDLKYDSYLDKTSVSGKAYFRVRVGPVSTKNAAINLMKELQDNPRYQNSYIIHE